MVTGEWVAGRYQGITDGITWQTAPRAGCPLTHEFLSLMLGVRRAGVTSALQALEKKGLISRNRGNILIPDRKGLQKKSNGTYVPSEI